MRSMTILKLSMPVIPILMGFPCQSFYHSPSNPHTKGPQNKHLYEPEKSKPNESRFKAVFIVSGKKYGSTKERKRKRDKSRNNGRWEGK